ncbi:MAG TPA: condensation domain-containing protein, partial [Pyrinomonadaceae bacterium]
MSEFNTNIVDELSTEKQQLLNMLLEEEGSELDSFPLSFAQQRLWFLDQLDAGSPFYNIPAALRLKGQFDRQLLERSLNEVIDRHEALRTTFTVVERQPVQVISPELRLTVPLISLESLPLAEREAEALRLFEEDARAPFDLKRGPLMRAKLLRLSEEEHVLLMTMHHIVSDGWSMGVLIREVAALYEAFSRGAASPLPELSIQYADFAVWQREWLEGEVLEKQLGYWREQLGGAPPVLELPTDKPRPSMQRFQGERHRFKLSKSLSKELEALSQREGATLFMTLLAAFQTLLYRYTNQDDIVVGSPVANRNRTEIEGLIGFFVNTLVMRTDLSGNPSFRELIGRVRETALGAYAHQDVPFEKLVEELQPERDMSRSPLFQVMFALQNASPREIALTNLQVEMIEADNRTAKFDLTLSMEETPDGLQGWWEYNTELFDETTVTFMHSHFQQLLSGIIANPYEKISALPLLSAEERRRLLVEWNDTHHDFQYEAGVHLLFEQQVERTPEH